MLEHCTYTSDYYENKLPSFLSFVKKEDEEEEDEEDFYHVCSTVCFTVAATADCSNNSDDDVVTKTNSIKKVVNPIVCVQYLAVLIDYIQVNTLKVISSLEDLEMAIQELVISVNTDYGDVDDEDGDVHAGSTCGGIYDEEEDVRQPEYHHVVSFYHNHLETGAEQEVVFKKIKSRSKPRDVIILFNNGEKGHIHNGIYVISNILSTQAQEEEETTVGDIDIEDGEVCTLLTQIGASLLSTVALLVAKQIRKYLKKHKKKKAEAKAAIEVDDILRQKPLQHIKVNEKEGKGEKQQQTTAANKRKFEEEEEYVTYV